MISFTRKPDEVFLVCSVLNRLDSGKVRTFQDRIRSQKIQYLAQVFKVVPNYEYNLYLRGPYSPQLAKDLFRFSESGLKAQQDKFASEELEQRFKKLRQFTRNKNARQLELIATFHWLTKVVEYRKNKSILKLKEIKNASETEVDWVLKEFEKIEI